MSKYIEKVEKLNLPLVALNGIVIFPGIPTSFEISQKNTIKAALAASSTDGLAFFSTKVVSGKENTPDTEVFPIGVVAKIKQALKLPDGSLRVLVEGKYRAELSEFFTEDELIRVNVLSRSVILTDNGGVRGEALMRETIDIFQEFIKLLPKISNEIIVAVSAISDPGMLADFIAANVIYKYSDKQAILSEIDPFKRLERLILLLENEMEVLKTEISMHKKVKEQLDQNQREYYLREQLKVIQNELGTQDGFSDIDEYQEKIAEAKLPKEVLEKLQKELSKLEKMPYSSAESTVIRNYLDTCLEIPWSKYSKGGFDVSAAAAILDKDHDGLKNVKDRILEYIAVRQLSPELRGQILCLVGPPGVGKTSIASSIARALKRKYVRVSLGGIRDEADIRGHRKTYIASMPGRIINALIQAKTLNPVILLDEIDKLTKDAHGDPSSALLEVLDTDQNKSFRDHFVEIPVDLSDCIFIATANTTETIPRPLMDRMEIIEISTYTRNEKISIFKNHLLPKELKRHGLHKKNLIITDDAIIEMIDFYTKESGVRNLSRETASLCRKVARKIVETGKKSFTITGLNLKDYLGSRKFKDDVTENEDRIGVVNGLAWTELGGEMLEVEVASMEGTGKIELTGQLGDVMKESAHAAISYIRTRCDALSIQSDFYKTKDIHIHVPEGAIPKDGPSAGITMATAVASELTGRKVKSNIAMTGEITLRGRVLPIGGLKEKTMAAYRHGITTVIIPYDNVSDLEEIDPVVRVALKFIPVRHIDEVLKIALLSADDENEKPALPEIHITPDAKPNALTETDGFIG